MDCVVIFYLFVFFFFFFPPFFLFCCLIYLKTYLRYFNGDNKPIIQCLSGESNRGYNAKGIAAITLLSVS